MKLTVSKLARNQFNGTARLGGGFCINEMEFVGMAWNSIHSTKWHSTKLNSCKTNKQKQYTYTRPHTRTHTRKQSELFLSGVYLRLQITGELFEIDNVG